jgi:FAD/FMN-containing dehydrogenase
MILSPSSKEELGAQLREADVLIDEIDLSELNQLIDHTPDDMTATVEAGMKLSDFQDVIRIGGQWLPVDPPNPEALSISKLISTNASGPSRYGFGTIRDWLIGVRFFLSDGRSIFNGGRVVKNVAGFDLCKLIVGSKGALGVITEATFKLMPIAEENATLSSSCESLEEASGKIEAIWDTSMQPSALDLVREKGQLLIVLGFSGSKPDVVAQMKSAENIGNFIPAKLDYESRLRRRMNKTISVLPELLIPSLAKLGDVDFVSRAGNGIIYTEGEASPPAWNQVEKRVKAQFDPKGILTPL